MENGDRKETYHVCKRECECDGPGHCPVYGIYMNQLRYERCKYDCQWRQQYSQYYADIDIADIETQMKNALAAREVSHEPVLSKDLDEVIHEIEEQGVNLQNYTSKIEGLGDLVGGVLSKMGISEERIKQWSGLAGCGCDKRKKFLNNIIPFRKKE